MGGVKFRAHMNLTSVDPPEVIRFVKRNYPEVELIKPRKSIYDIAVERKILPTMRVRWCCEDFKESAGAGKVTLIGIRHAESSRRAKRNEVEISSRKFSGTLDELDEYRQEQKVKREKRKSQKKGVNVMNADKEQTLGCIHGKESLLISPIIHWTESDVWEFLNDVMQVSHCELYDEGWHRIGCINCPMASTKQKILENKRWPHVKRNWIKAIRAIRNGRGLFKRKYLWWNVPSKRFMYSKPTTKASSSTTKRWQAETSCHEREREPIKDYGQCKSQNSNLQAMATEPRKLGFPMARRLTA